MTTAISPTFIRRIAANLQYWQQQTENVSDSTLLTLDTERHNLHRAVRYGLQVPETARMAAEVAANLFNLVERRGYWLEWLPLLEKIVYSPLHANHEHIPKFMNQLGFLYRLTRDFKRAEEMHQQAVERALAEEGLYTLGVSYFNLGNVYFETHAFEKARTFAMKAIASFTEADRSIEAQQYAAVYNLLGLVARAEGKSEMAQSYFEKAITYWRQTNDKTYLARSLSNLGLTLTDREQPELALVYFDEADQLLDKTASELDKVRLALNRGVAYYQLAQWHEAEEAFLKADSSYLRQSGDVYHQALVAYNLGEVLLQQGRFEDALTYLHQSAIYWQQIDDEFMLANTLGTIGLVYFQKLNTQAAKSNLEDAVTRLDKFSDNAWGKLQQRIFKEKLDGLLSEQ